MEMKYNPGQEEYVALQQTYPNVSIAFSMFIIRRGLLTSEECWVINN